MARVKGPSEEAFLRQVIRLARLHGWRVAHFRPARTARGWRTPVQADGKGWPDLVLVKGSRLLFAELKVGRGKLTPAQERWVEALLMARQDVRVWRETDWAEIVATLSREGA